MQICLCGTSPGYLHEPACPRPLYRASDAEEMTWSREYKLRDALLSALNVEGAALAGGELGAFAGLDVAWHFAKVRRALRDTTG